MAEIINLRRARKARKRGEAQAQAESNRARAGETMAERSARKAEAARIERTLHGARREGGDKREG